MLKLVWLLLYIRMYGNRILYSNFHWLTPKQRKGISLRMCLSVLLVEGKFLFLVSMWGSRTLLFRISVHRNSLVLERWLLYSENLQFRRISPFERCYRAYLGLAFVVCVLPLMWSRSLFTAARERRATSFRSILCSNDFVFSAANKWFNLKIFFYNHFVKLDWFKDIFYVWSKNSWKLDQKIVLINK